MKLRASYLGRYKPLTYARFDADKRDKGPYLPVRAFVCVCKLWIR
jgi:hypothetical protein